jgi:uncharacterized protein (UPF0333 family)
MKIRQCICVMVVFSLLLLNCMKTGWAEKEPVLDDKNNVITEAEIEENTGSGYRKGCAIGGGFLSAFPSLLGGGLVGEFISPEVGILIAISFEAAGITASYYIGKDFDRQRAINRIAQQKGWAEKNPVLDDDGYLITKAEIEENINKDYQKGFVVVGGCLAAIPAYAALFWGTLLCGFCFPDGECPSCSVEERTFWVLSGIAIEAAGITASYYIGKHFDRQRVINHIKAKRQQQKKHAMPQRPQSPKSQALLHIEDSKLRFGIPALTFRPILLTKSKISWVYQIKLVSVQF